VFEGQYDGPQRLRPRVAAPWGPGGASRPCWTGRDHGPPAAALSRRYSHFGRLQKARQILRDYRTKPWFRDASRRFHGQRRRGRAVDPTTLPRRALLAAALALLSTAVLPTPPAQAKNHVLSTRWHQQQQAVEGKLLAPLAASAAKIEASRRLQAGGDAAAALAQLRDAGASCYPFGEGDPGTAASIVTFEQRVSALQNKFGGVGVDGNGTGGAVCTFQMVVKNLAVRDVDADLKGKAYDDLADLSLALGNLDAALVGRAAGEASGTARFTGLSTAMVGEAELDDLFDAALAANYRLVERIRGLINMNWDDGKEWSKYAR